MRLAVFTPSSARRRPLSTVLEGDNGLVKASGSRGAMAPFEVEGKDLVVERGVEQNVSQVGSARFDVDRFLKVFKKLTGSLSISVWRRGEAISFLQWNRIY